MAGEPIRTNLSEAPGFGVWCGQPFSSMPSHWHEQVEINYAVGGSLTYLLAGSMVRVPPGRLAMFWAGMPHSVVDRTDLDAFYWVYVPLVWVLRWGLPNSFMRHVMGGEMIVDAEPLEADLAMLDRWSKEMPHADDARHRLIIREVETRVTRLALNQTDEPNGEHVPTETGPVRKVSEMARFLAENHAGPLRLKDVARHVRLHPNYAMTLFRRHYGITLSTYLTWVRVCHAQYLLLSTDQEVDQEVSRIAFETGFGSISRFYEAFKMMSGRTPRQYRMLYEPPEQSQEPPFNPCAGADEGSYK